MKSPIALLSSLLDDVKRLNPGVKGLNRDIVTIENRFENEGYGFLAVALPSLCDSLYEGLKHGRFTCPPGFRKEPKWGTIPRLFSGMFCEVFDIETGQLKDPVDTGILRDLIQILKLFKKVQLSPSNEELLHEKAVAGFYECDDVATLVDFPERHDHLIRLVSRLILPSLDLKEMENAAYKQGPGAVEERVKPNQKWSRLASAIREDGDLPDWTNLRGVFDSSGISPLHCRSWKGPVVLRSDFSDVGPHGYFASIGLDVVGDFRQQRYPRAVQARLISVAKSSTSRRTITIEPLLRMYMQQGLNTVLRDSINECPVLRLCLDLTDQAKNQTLALEGSTSGNWATLDLKSASDLLSLKLVRSVFGSHPKFLGYLEESRSPFVKCENKPLLTLGKFAGMGNATTFPVQSICFAVVCIAAILDSWGTKPTYWNVRRAARNLRIYGDDIIVNTKFSHQVVDWLQIVGLKVNEKKSFLTGNFRESCGVDAYKGVQVTPAYCRYRPDYIGESPSSYAGFVSLSNHLWKLGLYSSSTWIKDQVEASLGRCLPLVSSQSGVLGWHSRQEASTAQKWCRDTHQFLVKADVLVPLKRDDKLDGYGALLKCLSSMVSKPAEEVINRMPEELVHEKDHLSKTVIRFKPRMTRRWVPVLQRTGYNLEV